MARTDPVKSQMKSEMEPASLDGGSGPRSAYSETAVVAIIEDRIRRGVYAPGSRVPAERTLADELGVSRRLARLAYSQLIDKGVLDKSHYRTPFVAFHSGASEFAGERRRTEGPAPLAAGTIAAVLPSHPVFPGGLSIVAGIHKVLADEESPFRLTFLDTFHADRPEVLRREAKAIKTAVEDGAAGLIWWHYCDEETVAKVVVQNPAMPIVFIDRRPHGLPCDFVGIDDVESSRAAVEYLIDLNHTRIAHLMDPGAYSTIEERAAGYRAAHEARGLPLDEMLTVHLDWDPRRMEHAFEQLFSLAKTPTALFTTNDFIAHEFIQVAEAKGVRVPDDLSVVGHGNMDRYTPRAFLTSVDQPFEMFGRAAAKVLLKRLTFGPSLTQTFQHIILPTPLIVRASSRRLDRLR